LCSTTLDSLHTCVCAGSHRVRVRLSGLINGRNQLNSWGFPQAPHSSSGLCRTLRNILKMLPNILIMPCNISMLHNILIIPYNIHIMLHNILNMPHNILIMLHNILNMPRNILIVLRNIQSCRIHSIHAT
jgi:hypothetical protein